MAHSDEKDKEEILEIKSYKRYKQMTIEELENIISQIGVKRGISEGRLNVGVTDFLLEGDNSLTISVDENTNIENYNISDTFLPLFAATCSIVCIDFNPSIVA